MGEVLDLVTRLLAVDVDMAIAVMDGSVFLVVGGGRGVLRRYVVGGHACLPVRTRCLQSVEVVGIAAAIG